MRAGAAALGLSLAAALLLGPACEVQGQGQDQDPEDALQLELQLRPDAGGPSHSLPRGRPITFLVVLRNRTDAPQRLTFESAKTHDVTVSGPDGEEVWRMSEGLFYAQVITEIDLPPHGLRELPAQWHVPADAEPGEYRARAIVPTRSSTLESDELSFTIE